MAQKTQNLENQRFCKVLIPFKYCKSDRRRIKFPATLRFENQQKKTSPAKKQKQAIFFSLLCFQFFVDLFVIAEGFEPSTACLEGRCSIQLSYATIRIPLIIHKLYVVKSTLSTKALNNFPKINFLKPFVGVAGFEPATSCSQSRRDNRATLHPDGVVNQFSTERS